MMSRSRLPRSPLQISRRLYCGLFVLLLSCSLNAQNKPTQPTEQSCSTFAQGFYDWYLSSADGWRDVPSNKKYPLDEKLVRLFAASEREEKRTDGVIIDCDPFFNSQDPAEHYIVRKTSVKDGLCRAEVYGTWTGAVTRGREGPDVIAELVFRDGKWIFVNFRYPGDDSGAHDLITILTFETRNDRKQSK